MALPFVLIVEDDRIIAQGIRILLERRNYRTRSEVNGEGALRAIKHDQPDLIIMDIHLGKGPNGIDVAKEVGKSYDIPIIFLTRDRTDHIYQDAISTVPYLFLHKPFPDAELINLIEVAIRFTGKHKAGLPRKDVWINKSSRESIKLHLPDILFVKAQGAYTYIHLHDVEHQENKVITLVKSSNHVLPELAFPSLIKIHRSYHVNLLRIQECRSNKVYAGGQWIPVSKAYRTSLETAIARLKDQ